MNRINTSYTDSDGVTRRGWFDLDTVTEDVKETTRWDGHNHIGVMSGLQCGYENLYRTAGGRWVRYYNARAQHDGPEYYEFITDEQARKWLLQDGDDEIVEKWFGQIESESGPNLGGRPEIGGKALTSYGEDLLAWLTETARARGVSRNQLVRDICTEYRTMHTVREFRLQVREADGTWCSYEESHDDLTAALERRDELNQGIPAHKNWKAYRVVDSAGVVQEYVPA